MKTLASRSEAEILNFKATHIPSPKPCIMSCPGNQQTAYIDGNTPSDGNATACTIKLMSEKAHTRSKNITPPRWRGKGLFSEYNKNDLSEK